MTDFNESVIWCNSVSAVQAAFRGGFKISELPSEG